MRVKELIAELEKMPQDAIVLISSDREGNRFSELRDIDGGNHIATREGSSFHPYFKRLNAYLEIRGYSEEDVYHGNNGEECVILWP